MTQSDLASNMKIRPVTPDEMRIAVDWAAAEGWNPGLHDAEKFLPTDPDGFMCGDLEGEIVAFVSSVIYDQTYGFLGFFMVKPEMRGLGLGRKIARASFHRQGSRIAGLDGVVEQQETYKRWGFKMAFSSLRYQATGGGDQPEGLTPVAEVPWPLMAAYDAACFPTKREDFLKRWVDQPGGAALAVMVDGELQGFGVLRPCREGFKIGPLFADGPAQAELLYQGLLAKASGEPVFLDAPQNNPEAVALVKRHGLEPIFECGRMYINGEPLWNAGKVFGITTFELG
jgi:ribosomal protein S18 acetylase RimI-like enzyme